MEPGLHVSPILRSGLSALVIQPTSTEMKSLIRIQRKLLRAFLGLSTRCPVPSIYHLLGELPIEGQIARDVFSLFWNVWSNRDTLVHKVVKYLLIHAKEDSRTWAVFLRHQTRLYGLPDPLTLLGNTPPSKDSWKSTCHAVIYAYHERELRLEASVNSQMKYLNIDLRGLSTCHPILHNITSEREVRKLKVQLKILSGDFYPNGILGDRSKSSTKCILCDDPYEDDLHVFGQNGCSVLQEVQNRVMSDSPSLQILLTSPAH